MRSASTRLRKRNLHVDQHSSAVSGHPHLNKVPSLEDPSSFDHASTTELSKTTDRAPPLRNTKKSMDIHDLETEDEIPSVEQIEAALQSIVETLNDPNLTDEEKAARQAIVTDSIVRVGFMATDATEIGLNTAKVLQVGGTKALSSSRNFHAGITSHGGWVF